MEDRIDESQTDFTSQFEHLDQRLGRLEERMDHQHEEMMAYLRSVKLNLSVLEDIDDDVELCMNLSKEESVIVLTGKKQATLVDPSGSYFSWKASAMGKNVSNAKTFLEKRYTDDMELDDAVHTAILTLKEGYMHLKLLFF
ncbi:hypothetical protein AAG906_031787 [Vitis piasezkii]